MSVFYIENPLCGELIYEGEDAVVCRRSDEQIPDDFPMASDYWTEGLLFAGTSMYAVPVPYVVSVTEYPRIAEAGEPADPLEVLRYAISLIDAESAEDILFSIRAKWNAEPDGEDGARWYSLVCALVDRIAASGQVKGHFRANTPCLICAGYVDRNDVDRARRREIAEQWLSQQRRYELVHEHFCLLGVPTMEVVCACRGGYAGTEYDNTEGIC